VDTGGAILAAACFRLGLLGAQVTDSFSDRIASTGLTHKQVGLLAVVGAGLASSQRDIAARLRVAPSLVVALVDQLEALGAVYRRRSAADRRVQVIELTDKGSALLADSAAIAQDLDIEFRAKLSPSGLAGLDALLADLERLNPLTP
jgi:DNA-binding MarR family transcriptional regulator